MSVPFAEFVGKHAFDGVPAERADRLLFTAEKPSVLIGVQVIVPYFQCQVVRNRYIFHLEGEIVFLVLFPRDIVDRLVLVVQGWVFAGKEQRTSQCGNDSFKLPALCPACFPVWQQA